jgi:hypothetical protein
MHIGVTKERLIDLQRTVDTLHGRIQEMQCELRQATRHSAERWWRNLLGTRQGEAFMSACCNRRVRPNTKVVNHAGTRTDQ